MKFAYGIPVILLAATNVMVMHQVAVALEPQEIGIIAKKITVSISGPNPGGTGIIVEKQGNIYTVLTNWHVVDTEGKYTIHTQDGKRHQVNQVQQLGRVDLATLRFKSNQNYEPAKINTSNQRTEGTKVYTSGFARIRGCSDQKKGCYKFFREGSINEIRNPDEKGYELVHSSQVRKGMSGGPLLDEDGKLLGINGRAITSPGQPGTDYLAIPIKTYLKLDPYKNYLPVATNPPLPLPQVNAIAKKITVRISGPKLGTGVIVKKEGNTYTVLTNWHVVDTSGTYTIQTQNGRRYQVKYSQVQRLPRVDLAVFQFQSNQTYDTANIANSDQVTVGTKVYAAGWANTDAVCVQRCYQFRGGNISTRLSNAKNGYTWIYTNSIKPGMSGGPVLDDQGRLVGINGLGLRDPRTGTTDYLAIPINTYVKLATFRT